MSTAAGAPSATIRPPSISTTRSAARRHYLIDAASVVVKALQALVEEGRLDRGVLTEALGRYQLEDINAGTSGSQGGES